MIYQVEMMTSSVATKVLTSISSNSNGAAGGECRNLLQPETGHFINCTSYNLEFDSVTLYSFYNVTTRLMYLI